MESTTVAIKKIVKIGNTCYISMRYKDVEENYVRISFVEPIKTKSIIVRARKYTKYTSLIKVSELVKQCDNSFLEIVKVKIQFVMNS